MPPCQSSRATIRDLLETAHAEAPDFGHPYEGFLSESFGFLFPQPPLLSMPASHVVWDETAAALPAALESGRACCLIDALPKLPADAANLDASYLCRAATILGVLAHAYETEINARRKPYIPHPAPRPALPDCVELPWTQVCQRLGRRQAAMTYYDLILHNWRARDPAAEHPRDVENLDVLVPAFGNQEERIFYMTMVESHARSAALIGAVARIEEAILRGDLPALKAELQLIQRTLDHITFQSFLKIDPNPYSSTYVDPLVWSKTVGPFGASTREGELGLSGAGGPVFHLLDALFERQRYDSQIAHESKAMLGWIPQRHFAFIEATGRIGLAGFVEKAGDSELAGLYHGALEAYAGKRGWLGMHRLKVYGFMELGFRGGRTQTNGGFHGTVEKQAWETLDDTLEQARQERRSEGAPLGCPFARRQQVQAATGSGTASVKHVTLNVAGQGFVYEPGDRIGVLTQNSADLVSKTLAALRASGDELVPLNSVWREAMRQFPDQGPAQPAVLSLAEFLARAKIRPLLRPVGKALHALTRSPHLKAILEAREEDEWEFWDILELLASEHYDTRRLWKSEIWQAESIARLVPPQQFRVFSISSAPEAATADSLDLTVGALSYESKEAARHGTASHFLAQHAPEAPSVPTQLVRPSRFRLPVDRQRPIVMFAAGTGFSPFRGFLQARSQQASCGEAHLFFGTTTPEHLPYRAELERWIAADQLNLHVAFSRAKISVVFEDGRLIEQPGPSGYVDILMEQPDNASRLWAMLRHRRDGGDEGYFYICGQTRFAHTVICAIKKVIARFLPASGPEDPAVQIYFRRLVAEGRFMCDIFTTFASASAPGVLDYRAYDTSEVVLHNNQAAGYWMIVQGNVYDVTEFRYLHPGGDRLLVANAGLDATRSYEKAEHHLNSEVHALLDLYKIGRIRRLDFKDVWGIALAPGPAGRVLPTATATQYGVIYLSLHDLYRHWVRYLFKIVDCENAVANNFSLRRSALCGQSPGTELNHLKAELLIDIHALFESDYVPMLIGARLRCLWNATIGFCDNTESVSRLGSLITAVEATPEAQHARQLHAGLVAEVAEVDGQDWHAIDDRLERMEHASAALLAAFKQAIRKGVQVFEALESETTRKGGPQLIEALCSLPQALSAYYASVR